MEIIPHLNQGHLIELALHLTFKEQLNDKQIWHQTEAAILDMLELFTLEEICLLEWATQELKPKQVSAHLSTLFFQKVSNALVENTANLSDLWHIQQGFRKRESKDLYQKIRRTLIDRKE